MGTYFSSPIFDTTRIPKEVWLLIIKLIWPDCRSLLRLSAVCRHLRCILKNDGCLNLNRRVPLSLGLFYGLLKECLAMLALGQVKYDCAFTSSYVNSWLRELPERFSDIQEANREAISYLQTQMAARKPGERLHPPHLDCVMTTTDCNVMLKILIKRPYWESALTLTALFHLHQFPFYFRKYLLPNKMIGYIE